MLGRGRGRAMGDEEEQRLVWKLKVGVRVRRFSLKLHLQNPLSSSWKLHRLRFLLRFRKHHLKVASYSKPDGVPKPRSRFRFKFLRSLLLLLKWKRRE
ncbi:unnamed protein product, partial [Thlaspi arvense]